MQVTSVKLQTNARNNSATPFDQFYVIQDGPDQEQTLEEMKKIEGLRVCYIYRPTATHAGSLNYTRVLSYEEIGQTRNSCTKTRYGHQPKLLEALVNTAGAVLVVPVKPGRELAYIAKKSTRAACDEFIQKSRGADATYYTNLLAPQKDVMGTISICIDGKERTPCSTCRNWIKKLDNPTACTLGSTQCLSKLFVPYKKPTAAEGGEHVSV